MTSPARVPVAATPSTSKPRRRKQMTLGFQLRAVFPVVVFGVLFAFLTLVVVWIPMHRMVAADPSPIVKALMQALLFRVELWLAPLLLICAGVSAVVALLRARRLSAPVSDIRDGLAKLAVGDPEPLKLQPRDEFRELEAPFNALVSRMEFSQRNNLEMLRMLRRNLDGIAQRSAKNQLSDKDLQESIAVLLRDVENELKKLQVKP